jgi:membrane-associated protein
MILLDIFKYINPEYLLKTYGAFVIFFILFVETGCMAFFLPGDSLLITAGLFCGSGLLGIDNVWVLIAAIAVTTVAGDSLGYFIGTRIGVALYDKKDTWYFKQKYITQTREFYDKHGNKAIIIGKFAPIIRSIVPVLAGVGQLKFRRYISYSMIGAIIWATSMTLLGYYLFELAQGLGISQEKAKKNLHLFLLAVIFISLIPAGIGALKARKNAKNNG